MNLPALALSASLILFSGCADKTPSLSNFGKSSFENFASTTVKNFTSPIENATGLIRKRNNGNGYDFTPSAFIPGTEIPGMINFKRAVEWNRDARTILLVTGDTIERRGMNWLIDIQSDGSSNIKPFYSDGNYFDIQPISNTLFRLVESYSGTPVVFIYNGKEIVMPAQKESRSNSPTISNDDQKTQKTSTKYVKKSAPARFNTKTNISTTKAAETNKDTKVVWNMDK